ncbi:hypothetical protein BpHYR1_034345 [Brachionus plicatilis]|uniref:Uncharacterized protein n=1 Tax=Brachionus plicatilis TaxID=10195 RepID=A0A3M7RQP0_BRAPC|nr:hypothetical protein BpHYR1_034345 [Brachionus plicatilis]
MYNRLKPFFNSVRILYKRNREENKQYITTFLCIQFYVIFYIAESGGKNKFFPKQFLDMSCQRNKKLFQFE